jgi:hypothetical protein
MEDNTKNSDFILLEKSFNCLDINEDFYKDKLNIVTLLFRSLHNERKINILILEEDIVNWIRNIGFDILKEENNTYIISFS